MRRVLGLEELLHISDPESEYGLKAVGLAKLKNIVSSQVVGGFPIVVPDAFAVGVSIDLESSEVREAYARMTSNRKHPRIILARSSDPEEEPGRFESHPSLYDPADPEGSFNGWLTAARRVKESGARALIGQVLAGEMVDFNYDQDSGGKPISVQSFGGDLSGFVGNSTSIVMGDEPVIVACLGLPSKIVRGDLDACLLYRENSRNRAVNLRQNYWANQYSLWEQQTIDLIKLEDAENIVSLPYRHPAPMVMHGSTSIPFYYNPATVEHPDLKFRPFELLDLMEYLFNKVESHVEVEGSVGQSKIYLFQHREYEVPPRRFQELTEVSEDRLIFKTKSSFGFNQFRGDFVVAGKLIDVPERTIFLYVGDTHTSDLASFEKYRYLIFGAYRADDLFAGMHTLGQAVQTIVKLEKSGVEAVAIGGSYDKLLSVASQYPQNRVEHIEESVVKYKDVTVECDGMVAQIYFNKTLKEQWE
jgi:hypothetical protein